MGKAGLGHMLPLQQSMMHGLCPTGSEEDVQSLEDRLQDVVMMRLRTADGLDLEEVGQLHGSNAVRRIEKALQPHEAAGLVTRVHAEVAVAQAALARQHGAEDAPLSRIVRLADPEGFLVSNDIISDVFAELMPH